MPSPNSTRQDNPGVKASQVAHATQDHLQPRTGQNPRYKRLSERVNDIVERWRGGDMTDPETVEALQSIEEDVLAVDDEATERGMDDAEFAIYTHLTEENSDTIESDGQAEEVAEDIVNEFDERVERGYPGWKTNPQTAGEIERIALDTLIIEHDLGHLMEDDEFVDAVRGYLIENHA